MYLDVLPEINIHIHTFLCSWALGGRRGHTAAAHVPSSSTSPPSPPLLNIPHDSHLLSLPSSSTAPPPAPTITPPADVTVCPPSRRPTTLRAGGRPWRRVVLVHSRTRRRSRVTWPSPRLGHRATGHLAQLAVHRAWYLKGPGLNPDLSQTHITCLLSPPLVI
jgi:hypothetical protein